MRPRRRRSHSRRQVGVISDAGGDTPIDSETQGVSAQNNADGQQRPFSTSSESGISPTERAQPAHHAMPSIQLQPPISEDSLLSIAVQTTSSAGIGHITSSVASPRVSARSSSSLVPSHSSTFSLSSSTPASSSAPLNASQSYTSPSPAVRASASHSAEFYGGIALGAVFLLACLVAFATWLVRSRRKGSGCCFGGKEDEDIENRDLGFGLGLYLDKHADGLEPRNEPLTPVPELAYGTVHSIPPVQPNFQSITHYLGQNSTATTRPSTTHLLTDESIRTPSRLLGPLQIKNYVSGDFASSSDEAILTPSHERAGGRTREQELGSRAQFLSPQAQGRNAPWAPLNIKSSPAPNRVNIAHSASKKSKVAQAETYEDAPPLPMPPFGAIQSRKGCVGASDHECGAVCRSNLCGTISGLGGSAPKPEKDNPMPIPGNYTHASRLCDVTSLHKATGAEYVAAPEPLSSITHRPSASPNIGRNDRAFNQPRNGTTTLDSIGFALRTAEREESAASTSLPVITPLVLRNKRSTDTQRKRHITNVKSRSSSRASSVYSPFPSAPRLSTRRRPEEAKEDMTSRTSMSARNKPEFLRRPTTGSVTSFSSEASDPSGPLTDGELRARRVMMLRARRKRGMSTTSGSGRRLTRRVVQTVQSVR